MILVFQYVFISFDFKLSFILAKAAQGAIICDLLASTNIKYVVSGWNCTNGVPVSDVCGGSWSYIKCSTEVITSIYLGSLSLTGTLPSSLGSLSSLTQLDFSWNNMYGHIPNTVLQLSSLVYLNLEYNIFSGSISSSLIIGSSLKRLYLDGNKLSGSLATNLCENSLSLLYIDYNSALVCYDSCLLTISKTNFGIVETCAKESKLPTISPTHSPTVTSEAILCDVLQATNLMTLHESKGLTCSQSACVGPWVTVEISTTSHKIVTCDVTNSRITKLNLNGASISGTLPSTLGQLSYLEYLDLNGNYFGGSIPTSFGGFSFLQTLDLGSNLLTGAIPLALGTLSSVRWMHFENNLLTGTIPSPTTLIRMKNLSLQFNDLVGSLPSDLCGHNLTSLDFSYNEDLSCYAACLTTVVSQDHGTVAPCTSDISPTVMPTASFPTMSPTISVSDQDKYFCEAIGTRFKDGINSKTGFGCVDGSPEQNICNGSWATYGYTFCNTEKEIIWLNFAGLASFRGTVPTALGMLVSLTSIDLSECSLNGTIPAVLGELPRLHLLNVGSNSLAGTVPTSLAGIPRLTLSQNLLTGSVPASLCTSRLRQLALSANNFSCYSYCLGTIVLPDGGKDYLDSYSACKIKPTALPTLSPTSSPTASEDSIFCDIIAATSISSVSSLWRCSTGRQPITRPCNHTGVNWDYLVCGEGDGEVTELQLANLKLTGTLPSSIGDFKAIISLDVSSNSLTGSVPSSLCALTGLTQLLISNNPFACYATCLSLLQVSTGDIPPCSSIPSSSPTIQPTTVPTTPTVIPTSTPSSVPSAPTWIPTTAPTISPNADPTIVPTSSPTIAQDDVICDLYYAFRRSSKLLDWDCTSATASSVCSGWTGVTCESANIVSLSLSSKSLQGTLPSSLGKLLYLTTINLNTNSITGSIPYSLANLTNLQSWDLSSNSITGSLPMFFGGLNSLTTINLGSNLIGGNIPGNFTADSVLSLKLQSNKLTGTIPRDLGGKVLQSLYLDSNSLVGSVPSGLCRSSLSFLQLYASSGSGSGSGNSRLTCYASCLSSVTTKAFGSLGICGAGDTTSSAFPSGYLALIVLLLFFCCLLPLGSLIYCLYRRRYRQASATKLARTHWSDAVAALAASESIAALTLDDQSDVLNPVGRPTGHAMYSGKLTLKGNATPVDVDVFVGRDANQLRLEYAALFHLSSIDAQLFCKPYGFIEDNKLAFLSNQSADGIYAIALESGGVAIETYLGSRSEDMTFSHNYLDNMLNLMDDFPEEDEQKLDQTEIKSDKLTALAKDLMEISITSLQQNILLSSLSVKQFRLCDGTVKLFDGNGITVLGERLALSIDNIASSLAPDAARFLTSKQNKKIEMLTSSGLLATAAHGVWGLGILLFELYTGRNWLDCLVTRNADGAIASPAELQLQLEQDSKNSVSLNSSIVSFSEKFPICEALAQLNQKEVETIIDKYCSENEHWCLRKLLVSLLTVDPSTRPQVSELGDLAIYLESYENIISSKGLRFFMDLNIPEEIFLHLISSHPECTSAPSEDGLLPIQYALQKGMSISFLSHLIAANPATVKQRFPVDLGSKALIAFAVEKNMSEETIGLLLPYFMPVDKVSGAPLVDHGYGWTLIVSHVNPPDKYLATVGRMLEEYIGHVEALANSEDEQGRTAVHIATNKCKQEILQNLYFLGKYEFRVGPAEHLSHSGMVRLAVDVASQKQIALKFMNQKKVFIAEKTIRELYQLSSEYVLGALDALDGDENESFRTELVRKGYSGFKYCLVMEQAERTLHSVIAHEHIAGKDWGQIKTITTQLLLAVQYIQSKGIFHGDIKPLNVMRVRGKFVLIDFDSSMSYSEGRYAGFKCSSGFVPPELVHAGSTGPIIKSYVEDEFGQPLTEDLPYSLILAHPSYDMWSLGVTLFQLFTATPLFLMDISDHADKNSLLRLAAWSDSFKSDKLAVIADAMARNFLAQLLNKVADRRPDPERCLAHPFITGRSTARLPGEKPEFDVYLSSRGCDVYLAEKIYRALTIQEIRVWWVETAVPLDKTWEEEFSAGMAKSRAFVPLLSREAINSSYYPMEQNFSNLREDSPCDNLYLEHRLALELRAMGFIEKIYPIMIGDNIDGVYSKYFENKCHPTCHPVVVAAVEDRVMQQLDKQGLGAPLNSANTVSSALGKLVENQGGFVEGPADSAFAVVIDKIVGMIRLSQMAPKYVVSKKGKISNSQSRIKLLIEENNLLKENVMQLEKNIST